MSEVADLTDMVAGFEEHNSCMLVMQITSIITPKDRDLLLVMTAYPKDTVLPEASCLASVSVKCSATNLAHWNSALTHAMYALDFQLALNELGHAEPKKSKAPPTPR